MRLREIERLRGVAVLMVVVHHLARFSPWPAFAALRDGGWTGVDLFFVVSGFVVGASLLRGLPRRGSWRERWSASGRALHGFYVRRALRLFPLAWLWALVPLWLAARLGGGFGEGAAVGREVLAVVTFRYNFFAIGAAGEKLAWFWSLAVEEQFYLVLPLALVLVPWRRLRVALAVVGVLAVVLFARPPVVPTDPTGLAWKAWRYAPWQRCDALLLGVLVALARDADVLARVRRSLTAGGAAVLSLGLSAAIFALPMAMPFSAALGVGSTAVALLSTALVFAAALDRGLVFEIPGLAAPLEWLGARSYALYLVHPTVLRLVLERGPLTAATLGGFVALTFAAVEASHRWVERPGLAWGRRMTRPRAAAMPAAAG